MVPPLPGPLREVAASPLSGEPEIVCKCCQKMLQCFCTAAERLQPDWTKCVESLPALFSTLQNFVAATASQAWRWSANSLSFCPTAQVPCQDTDTDKTWQDRKGILLVYHSPGCSTISLSVLSQVISNVTGVSQTCRQVMFMLRSFRWD